MQERNNCCLGKILKLIQKLQCACECEQIDNTCSKPFLGTPVNVECYNTRPITFYGCNNNLIEINYSDEAIDDIIKNNSFKLHRPALKFLKLCNKSSKYYHQYIESIH